MERKSASDQSFKRWRPFPPRHDPPHFTVVVLNQWRYIGLLSLLISLLFIIQGPSCQAQISEGLPINRLETVGTQRRVHLEMHLGDPLNRGYVSHEVHRLWSTGWFDDIRVEATPEPGGVGLAFCFVEKPRYVLRRVELKPSTTTLAVRIKPGATVDRQTAHQTAVALQNQLIEQGHLKAEVEEQLIPVSYGQADLHLNLKPGPVYRVSEVRFSGPAGFDPGTLENALRFTRIRRILPPLPGLSKGWQVLPPFSYQRVEADLEALRSFYFSRGYWDASVNFAGVDFSGRESRLMIAVDAGRHHKVGQTQVVKILPGRATITSVGGNTSATELCSCLRQAQQEAEKEGRVDFSVRAEVWLADGPSAGKPVAADQWVALRARIETGSPYTVGRIEFRGNHNYSDSTLRRLVVLNEGDPFDYRQLRKSLSRLNTSGFFKPITKDQVIIQRDPTAQQLDLMLNLVERARGGWSLSGSLEPLSIVRPIQFLVGSHLPDWGGQALELSTYFVALSLSPLPQMIPGGLPLTASMRWLPRLSVGRPYLPAQEWRSGFVISPQLGWQGAVLSSGLMRTRVVASNLNNPGEPERLAVPVWHESELDGHQAGFRFAGSLLCGARKSRLDRARSTGLTALNLMLALPMI